ncbi:MAG: endo-1,4-beta-xylanase, partial [Alphaproteobacteria bacterium]|nr:endo-1,4-beta-xylanase [Alphaproteobacteria bacterium]
LFETYKDYFRVGAAVSGMMLMSPEELEQSFNHFKKRFEEFKKQHPEIKIPEPEPFPTEVLPDLDLAKKHFKLIVAENDTKMGAVYQGEDNYNWTMADRYVKFARENNQDLRWHTLVWHNQSPDWIFKDDNGNKVSKEVLENRLKKYIFAVGKRYANDICSVDVVNECISDKNFVLRDGNDRSQWFDILGPDYVDKAFFWAKEAFPKSSLVINDYNLEMIEGKRQGMYKLVKGMLERGVPVDTVGLQMHINIQNPPISEIEQTIELFGSLGLNVIVTEMEVSAYIDKDFEHPDPRREYTKEFLDQQAERYYQLFECFKKEAKAGILKDVVLWGITDRLSWKNNFPAPGRTDCPLLFDNDGKPKPAFDRLTKF